MPSNQNLSRAQTADENGNNVAKSLVLNPSEPMYRAFMEVCAEREASLFGTTFDSDDPIDIDLKRGMKTEVLKEALTAYLNAHGKTWEEPEDTGRTSDMFNIWRRGGVVKFEESRDNQIVEFGPPIRVSPHVQGSLSAEDYKARYKAWYTEVQQDKAFYRRNYGELAVKQMQKMQSLVAMGTSVQEALSQAMAAFPPGTIVAERKTRQRKG